MKAQHLFERFYYARPGFRGGTEIFHALCRRHLARGGRVLEIGAGPENKTSRYLSSFACVVGIDLSEEVVLNMALAAPCRADAARLPFRDASFDGCVSNYVIEHLAEPEQHLREVARVLKPGGVYCFRTPNLWHYVTLGSRLLPYRLHLRWANWLRDLEGAHDPYPVCYRMNTGGAILRAARRCGLVPVEIHYIEAEPWYGRRHPALFYPMMLYERVVNSSRLFQPFRMNIQAALAKAA